MLTTPVAVHSQPTLLIVWSVSSDKSEDDLERNQLSALSGKCSATSQKVGRLISAPQPRLITQVRDECSAAISRYLGSSSNSRAWDPAHHVNDSAALTARQYTRY